MNHSCGNHQWGRQMRDSYKNSTLSDHDGHKVLLKDSPLLDHVRLQGQWPDDTMQLIEQSASIA